MKTKYSSSLIAIAVVLGAASLAMAADTNTFDASVSVLSPDQTGFLIGGQVAVNGVGTGALTMTRSLAEMNLMGGASSALVETTGLLGAALDGVESTAFVESALSFEREISTSGALVGLGSVVSRGEAIAALGSAGAASGNTSTAGTRAAGTINAGDLGGEGTATADASAQGSLNGSLSTTNTLQLLGASGLFAGSNGTTVGERNDALAYGSALVLSDGVTGIDLTGASSSGGTGTDLLAGAEDGALFLVMSDITSGDGTIDLTVSNAGNGSISISTSTGGFFTGGGATSGSASFADTNSFFSPDITLD